MEFTTIDPLWASATSGVSSLFDTQTSFMQLPTVESGDAGAAFSDILTSAIENVRSTDAEKNQMEYLLSVGQLDNPAELTIATSKAQVAVDLLVQLRSRALEAHSEIMRIAI